MPACWAWSVRAVAAISAWPEWRIHEHHPQSRAGGRMRKLIYSMTVSLDGYISGPQGEFDWTAPDEELHRFHNDQVRELGGHLLGRRLCEVMSYWETAEERNPAAPQYALEFARIWKDLPKIVYSNTLTRVEGKTSLSSEDPVAEVPRLKEQPGEPLGVGVGGATLAAT